MESESVGNKGKFLSYVPNYNPRSANVRVTLNNFVSSEKKYCLIGKSEVYPDITFSYDSSAGGLLDKGKACDPVDSGDKSFSTVLASKKALIIYARGSTQGGVVGAAPVKAYLESFGYGTVDVISNPDPSVYKNYDVVVARGSAWSIDSSVIANLVIGYNNGAHILTDGNDANAANLPNFIKTNDPMMSTGASYNQTGNTGLSPAFPYTFQSVAFPSDSWSCMLEAQPGVVIIADSPYSKDPSKKCITASGMSSGEGRWVNLSFGWPNDIVNTSIMDPSMNWLSY